MFTQRRALPVAAADDSRSTRRSFILRDGCEASTELVRPGGTNAPRCRPRASGDYRGQVLSWSDYKGQGGGLGESGSASAMVSESDWIFINA